MVHPRGGGGGGGVPIRCASSQVIPPDVGVGDPPPPPTPVGVDVGVTLVVGVGVGVLMGVIWQGPCVRPAGKLEIVSDSAAPGPTGS